jgi:hypothetical protein
MAKQTPNVYLAIKHIAQAYESRKRSYLLRREAGEIDRDTEVRLVQELDCNLKREIDTLVAELDGGGLDGELDSDAEPENMEVING